MKLYEINTALEEALNNITCDEETGEAIGLDAIEQLQVERDVKIENTAKYIKNLKAEEDVYDAQINILKAEIENLTKQKKSVTNKVDNLKEYLSWNLNNAGIDKFVGDCVKISFRKSKTVELENEQEFSDNAENYKWYVFTKKLNKTLIKNEIEKGTVIPGASLVEHQNIQIK